jgi:hypothetical protein
MAQALVGVLSLPEDVNADFLELRAALPAPLNDSPLPG